MTVERASEGLAQMRISADSPRTAASKPPTPVRLTVADVASSLPTKPRVDFVDARVNDAPGPVRFVAFRNHYASSVTVKVKLATKVPVKTPAGTLQCAGESRWVTALRDVRAMENCHHEVRSIQTFFTHRPVSTFDRFPFQLTGELFRTTRRR
jgi:hypothetical protein